MVIKSKNAMGNDIIRLAKYRCYKEKEYEVIGITKHSETLEELVVCRALYGNHDLWVHITQRYLQKKSDLIEGRKM